MLEEGWYLLSPSEVERELPFIDDPSHESQQVRLSSEEALAFRNAGNLPDSNGRWLRLVLRSDDPDPEAIARRRAFFEPDFHAAPTWRREGSKPVNVIPLRPKTLGVSDEEAWWDDARMAAYEQEWREHGTVERIVVPGEYRSFVYKTVAALKAAGQEVTAESIADSVARWVPGEDADRIRAALLTANPE